eukprot:15482528-Alexandrium_andersonii.AAC.1
MPNPPGEALRVGGWHCFRPPSSGYGSRVAYRLQIVARRYCLITGYSRPGKSCIRPAFRGAELGDRFNCSSGCALALS